MFGLFGKKSPEELKNQTFTTEEGDHYIGELDVDQPDGFGTFTWADGSSYVGEWKDNKRHGQGTNTWADGREISGIWDDSEYLYKSVEKNLFEFLSNT